LVPDRRRTDRFHHFRILRKRKRARAIALGRGVTGFAVRAGAAPSFPQGTLPPDLPPEVRWEESEGQGVGRLADITVPGAGGGPRRFSSPTWKGGGREGGERLRGPGGGGAVVSVTPRHFHRPPSQPPP